MPGQKKRRTVLRLIGRRWRAIAVLVPLAVAEMAFDGALSLSYKLLIDNAIVPSDGEALVKILAALGGALLLGACLSIWRDHLFAKFLSRTLNDIRRAAFEHCQRLSVGSHGRRTSADILARFSTDIASLESWLAGAMTGLLLPAVGLVIGIGLLFFVLEWYVALIGALIWPLVLVGPRLIAPKAASAGQLKKESEALALANVEETIAAHRVIKAFSLQGFVRRRFETQIRDLEKKAARAGLLSLLVERTTVTIIYAVQVMAVAIGAFMAYRGRISVGSLVSFLTIFWNLGWLLVVIGRTAPTLVSAASSMNRIDELLNSETDSIDAKANAVAPAFQDSIRFEDVVFGYEKDKPILHGISFEIRRGEKVAFVGASGSGKSTVLNLLVRFYEPDKGRILFDGVDVSTYHADSLRAQMALVSQDSVLFDISIADNIRLGREGASDEEVEAAAKLAEIHDTICRMPGGYARVVGERGASLSGGERQRISIARALLRDPTILLLDEASSALDAVTEAAINETLTKVSRGRTMISVTHRLAGLESFDRIFVMERGRIVESGTHAALLERNGHYAKLWRRQSGFVVREGGQRIELTAEKLREIPLFANLGEPQLAMLARRFSLVEVRAGDVVFREGEKGRLFYVVVRGSVLITRKDERGNEVEVSRLADGDHFGEMALLHDGSRNATVTARTDSVFLTLTREQFLEMLGTTPDLRAEVERLAQERGRSAPRVATA